VAPGRRGRGHAAPPSPTGLPVSCIGAHRTRASPQCRTPHLRNGALPTIQTCGLRSRPTRPAPHHALARCLQICIGSIRAPPKFRPNARPLVRRELFQMMHTEVTPMGEAEPEVQRTLALASAPSGTGGEGPPHSVPGLKASTMRRLGDVLRADYAKLVQEPVPEALLAVLGLGNAPRRPT
jgi:hypothetical protein